ncbi:MAG: fatty acid desaturase [Bacteroidetes bacterium]|nr:fatty acid desaturase [Bacteroidota bacterium]
MGTQAEAQPRQDFYWVEDREPHFQRRKDILKSHPEVTKLFGVNPNLKFVTIGLVLAQFAIAFYIHMLPWWAFLLVTFAVGATIAQALFLAIHEITHDLAFKKKVYNNWLAFFANLPIVFPFAMSFKTYHAIHHWDQGKDGEDMDIPSAFETKIFRGFVGKVLWFFNQIVFYALRPVLGKPMKPDKWQVYNIIFQVAAMAVILPLVGWQGIVYLLLSLIFAGGLHPTSGHFISEHYVFQEGQETYSYYGPLNAITFNVGYHNEHHDFPTIPGSRLPHLKKMAPEYYDNLHSYTSWTGVIKDFLFTKKITLFSRTKRR